MSDRGIEQAGEFIEAEERLARQVRQKGGSVGGLTPEILRALSEPFEPNRIEWKPQRVNGRDALAVAYIDARDVMERLDSTVGGGWEFRWEPVGDDVQGRLTVCGVTREDVGEQGDGSFGATRKAAVSDALKRCGVQFGIGRYLYDLPAVWVAYDERKKTLAETPQLPDWALPRNGGAPRPTPVTQRTPSRGGYVDTEELQGGGDPGDLYGTVSDPALPPAGKVSKTERISQLHKYIQSTINPAYQRAASQAQQNSVAGALDALFPGNDLPFTTMLRHRFMNWAVGKDSVTKLTSGEASALIDWSIVGKDPETGKTDWTPRQDAIKAASAVVNWLDEQEGQGVMPLDVEEDEDEYIGF